MKLLNTSINTFLSLYMLVIKNYESELFSILFLLLLIVNCFLTIKISKKETINLNLIVSLSILASIILIFFYLLNVYPKVQYTISKVNIVAFLFYIFIYTTIYFYRIYKAR